MFLRVLNGSRLGRSLAWNLRELFVAGAGAGKLLIAAFRRFYRDDCVTMAAAISFYAVLSLIPLICLVIALMGYVLGSSGHTSAAVVAWVKEFIPNLSKDVIRNVDWVVTHRSNLGWLGGSALVIAAGLVFNALENALGTIFAVSKRRGFVRSRLLQAAIVVAMGCAFLFSFYVGVLLRALAAGAEHLPVGRDTVVGLTRGLRLQYLVSLALLLAGYTGALRTLPHVQVEWRDAFIGAVVGTVLWELARRIFTWYLANLAQFYVVYGSLGALVAVMVWIYLSATIFLYAAECVVTLRQGRPSR